MISKILTWCKLLTRYRFSRKQHESVPEESTLLEYKSEGQTIAAGIWDKARVEDKK